MDRRTEAILDASKTVDSVRGGAIADVNTIMDAAVTQTQVMIASAPIQDMIKEFQRNAETTHLRAISRFAGGMADINAVQSSAYLIGMALMEAEHVQSVDLFSAQLALNIYNTVIGQYLTTHGRYISEELGTFVDRFNAHLRSDTVLTAQKDVNRSAMINSGANDISRLLLSSVDGKRTVSSMQNEVSKTRIIAKSEETKQGVLYDVEDWLWDAKAFQYGSNVLSGISTGGQVLPEAPSQMSSTVSGVLSGAAVGAFAGGTKFGVPGAIAGAVIGGVGGYFNS